MVETKGESSGSEREPPYASLHTLGERLRAAIEGRPPKGRKRGQSLFAEDLEKRAAELAKEGVRLEGWTAPSIQSYVHDRVEPSRLFLIEAARLCNVRPEWLCHGHGAPTKAEEAARLAAEARRRHVLEREAIEGFEVGLGAAFEDLSARAEAAFWRLWGAVRGSLVEYVHASDTSGTHGDQETVDRELARRIGLAVRAPLEPFRFHVDHHWISEARWGEYVAGTCDALYALLAYPHSAEEAPMPLDWRSFIESPEEEANG